MPAPEEQVFQRLGILTLHAKCFMRLRPVTADLALASKLIPGFGQFLQLRPILTPLTNSRNFVASARS